MGILKDIGRTELPGKISDYVIATLALALPTVVCSTLLINLTVSSLLFVIVVVLLARRGNLASSIFASILATLCVAYLAPPAFSWKIDDPLDGVAVAAFLITSLVITQLVSRLRRMTEDALSNVDRRLVDAEERERAWIARELHDDINQRIAFVAINLDLLQRELYSLDAGARQRLQELQELISNLASDVQGLSHHLHSSKLEILGIVAAAKTFCEELSDKHALEIDVHSEDVPKSLPQEVSFTLFRVLQEALHNAVKHSGSAHFQVGLKGIPHGIELSVHDTGTGFDPETAMKGRGLGLISMHERVKLLKGEFSIASEVNRGTTIHARVPLH